MLCSITDINRSLDERFLYVSCWDTGELRQYDVSDPFTRGSRGPCAWAAWCGGRPIPRRGR